MTRWSSLTKSAPAPTARSKSSWPIAGASWSLSSCAVARKGLLRLGGEAHVLSPGVLVPVDAHVLHNVEGDPDVAILVSFFRQAEAHDEPDSTAQFE